MNIANSLPLRFKSIDNKENVLKSEYFSHYDTTPINYRRVNRFSNIVNLDNGDAVDELIDIAIKNNNAILLEKLQLLRNLSYNVSNAQKKQNKEKLQNEIVDQLQLDKLIDATSLATLQAYHKNNFTYTGGAKSYVLYNGKRYLLRRDKKQYILVKKKPLYLSDIKNKYKKVD